MIESTPDPINQFAKDHFGIDYLFPYQRLVVSNILEKRDQIVILPTGAGKSLCFSLPALLLEGPTLIIFPLLALMADQARRLEETGRGVAIIRGGQKADERKQIWNNIESGRVTYILSNPETLIQDKTLARLKKLSISHMVIDEAHTVSEWGDSFRPTYLKLAEIRRAAEIPQVTAFTATASEYVLKRIREIVFEDGSPNLVQAVPDRPNISYSVHPALSKDREVRDQIETAERPAIVFCRSRTATELTARMLRSSLKEEEIRFYHAGLAREEKKAVEEWFFESTDGILTATCAYGMGVDKADIRTVIHRDLPPSAEAYLQESGRGGRDRKPAEARLIFAPEDWRYYMALKHAPPETATAVARERYRSMLLYAASGKTCRREYLLSLLSAETDACFGCDVCRGEVSRPIGGLEEIAYLVRRYPRRFTQYEAALLLNGWLGSASTDLGLWRRKRFGALAGWSIDEIEEAVAAMVDLQLLHIPKKGPWKRRLAEAKKGKRAEWQSLRLQILGGND